MAPLTLSQEDPPLDFVLTTVDVGASLPCPICPELTLVSPPSKFNLTLCDDKDLCQTYQSTALAKFFIITNSGTTPRLCGICASAAVPVYFVMLKPAF